MYLHQRTYHRDPTIAFVEACEILLKNNRSICNRLFREPRGMLAAGQLADIIIPDYVPFTPLSAETFYGHLLFGLSFARIRTNIARGRVIVEDDTAPMALEVDGAADDADSGIYEVKPMVVKTGGDR